ncbi:MAG: alpha/beta hydrolase [Lachnospiraceae bacterium]|nr:alpha/beta hydrolase [Ruminococcus sp.]MCM1274396.1 alpha/beta hydrolase [Lachnospiraceae bacterium]
MTVKTFSINPEKTAFVRAYLPDSIAGLPYCEKRPSVVIFPGGGYNHCSDREGEPIALQYLAAGYAAFTVTYSVNARFPAALMDAAYTFYKIRMRAEEFHIDPAKIAVLGCSSGGHLAGCLATMWNDNLVVKTINCQPEDLRPSAAVLCYPVISGVTAPHVGSFEILLGEDPNRSDLSRLSLENRVTPKTPPIFMWHTANDDCVPAHNSLVMAKACISNKVPVELHIFDEGPHGLSTCDKATGWNEAFYLDNCRRWIGLSIEFLNKYMNV